MENLEMYVNSVNEIFSCLDSLDQNLENEDNSANINNLNEYKELAISFAKLVGGNINNSEDSNSDINSLMPTSNSLELDDKPEEEGDSNDW